MTGVGPGTSLADKIKQIQGFAAANDTAHACRALDTFIAQVKAQTGKKLSTAQGASFTTEARSIKSLLNC